MEPSTALDVVPDTEEMCRMLNVARNGGINIWEQGVLIRNPVLAPVSKFTGIFKRLRKYCLQNSVEKQLRMQVGSLKTVTKRWMNTSKPSLENIKLDSQCSNWIQEPSRVQVTFDFQTIGVKPHGGLADAPVLPKIQLDVYSGRALLKKCLQYSTESFSKTKTKGTRPGNRQPYFMLHAAWNARASLPEAHILQKVFKGWASKRMSAPHVVLPFVECQRLGHGDQSSCRVGSPTIANTALKLTRFATSLTKRTRLAANNIRELLALDPFRIADRCTK